jgi:hypothetical protein
MYKLTVYFTDTRHPIRNITVSEENIGNLKAGLERTKYSGFSLLGITDVETKKQYLVNPLAIRYIEVDNGG